VSSAGVIGGADLSGFKAEHGRVVVSIGREDEEPATMDWPQGFYLLAIDADTARQALGFTPGSEPI
jgi:hypothetical protein